MEISPAPIDFRRYRPGAVLVIDLMKHSTKPKAIAQRARHALETIFHTQVEALGITDIHFTYTGDGYMCVLAGDDSSRLLDFLNSAVPELLRELGALRQEFRAGVDFGLIHFARN